MTSNFHSLDGDSFKLENKHLNMTPGAYNDYVTKNKEGFCDTNGQCNIWTPPPPGMVGMPAPSIVRVVDTDYTTYSINYQCDDYTGFPRVWIYTRNPSPSQAEYDAIYAKMTAALPSFDHGLYMESQFIQGEACAYL